jgi:DNA-binding transcriptional ArsR family regulator
MASHNKKVGLWRGEEMSHVLLGVLHHPLRRAILRGLDGENPQSPTNLSDKLDANLSNVSYHFKILTDTHVIELKRTEQRRGATVHYYVSALTKNKLIQTILAETAKGDPQPKRPRR